MRSLTGALCALGAAVVALAFIESPVSAQQQPSPCDFMTAGGYIFPSGKATFGAAGGCKSGGFFGHLEYHDQAAGLAVHWISITAYRVDDVFFPDPNARLICGTATTNQSYGDVDFVVRAKDAGEPGINDEFDIRLTKNGIEKYSTFAGTPHKLGGGTGGGGNDDLHKPNNSVNGSGPCPAAGQQHTLTVTLNSQPSGTTFAGGNVTSDIGSPPINCSIPQSENTPGTQSGNCSASYAAGTPVTLTAQGANGAQATFAGCDSTTGNTTPTATCTVSMSVDRSVSVTFSFGGV